jgi:hypothetical protein
MHASGNIILHNVFKFGRNRSIKKGTVLGEHSTFRQYFAFHSMYSAQTSHYTLLAHVLQTL